MSSLLCNLYHVFLDQISLNRNFSMSPCHVTHYLSDIKIKRHDFALFGREQHGTPVFHKLHQ